MRFEGLSWFGGDKPRAIVAKVKAELEFSAQFVTVVEYRESATQFGHLSFGHSLQTTTRTTPSQRVTESRLIFATTR